VAKRIVATKVEKSDVASGLQCAQCGEPVKGLAQAIRSCGDCLYIYCEEHSDPGIHDCWFVCRECDGPEAAGA